MDILGLVVDFLILGSQPNSLLRLYNVFVMLLGFAIWVSAVGAEQRRKIWLGLA